MRYLSILRGINVSGHKIIKMEKLKTLYSILNFTDISTYIQSGNVVFCTPIEDPEIVQKKIEKKIFETFDFRVPVLILTEQKLKQVISNNPFSNIDLSKLAITFMDSAPDKKLVKDILEFQSDTEKFVIKKNIIYFHCTSGFGRTKLTNNFFENKLKVTATSRNWRTTNRLFKMINELSCE